MSAPQPSSSSGVGASQEYFVRIPKEMKKRQSIMKFHANYKVDFAKTSTAKLERENNLKQYKLSHEVDTGPKFGAGSEYGKDLKEEARRKKYGIYLKKYNPEDQPWLLKIGEGKQSRRFKGTKEGGISDNASYFVFTQCPDGAFEAYPVEEWYNFTPQINYKCLTSEEAEEEFSRRDKTMNYFSIMVKKRLKNEDGEEVEGEEKEKSKSKSKKKGKNFMLTDMDDWADLSEEDEDENDSEVEKKESGSDDDSKKKKRKKKGKRPVKKDKRKANSDDEALEESDDLDEGHEVDYMTDTDSSDDEMYANKDREDGDKYKEKGVEDEEGLKKIINSDDEEEEEKKEEEKDEEKEAGKKEDSDTESSGSSDTDSDLEKEPNVSSALLLLKKSGDKPAKPAVKRRNSGESEEVATPGGGTGGSGSRSATPTIPAKDKVAKKRKLEPDAVAAKKPKTDLPPMTSSDGINEETVRRYLMRKPMTSTDLVRKFKNTGLGKDQLVNTIAKILKRISPQSQTIKDKRFWFIKKPE